MLPPTTGPLHMLALPPGMTVFLLFFIHSPFSSHLEHHIPRKATPTSLTCQPPTLCSYEHYILYSIVLCTGFILSLFDEYLSLSPECELSSGRKCEILLSMGSAVVITSTDLVWCKHSINICKMNKFTFSTHCKTKAITTTHIWATY